MDSPRSASPPLSPRNKEENNDGGGGTRREIRGKQQQQRRIRILMAIQLVPVSILLLLLLLAAACCFFWWGLLGTVWLDHVYRHYHTPMVRALERTARHEEIVRHTDATYYHRPCSSFDLTTSDASQLLLLAAAVPTTDIDADVASASANSGGNDDDDESSDAMIRTTLAAAAAVANNKKKNQAAIYVDQMMRHGVGVIPDLLQPDTAARLRAYIVHRNAHLSAADAIHVVPNYRRKAFALDPAVQQNDDASVAAALHELVSHPVLKAVVAGLVGDEDPALTELAALTSFVGAQAQGWHHDVLPERGSAVQYARTYGHSYSLFVALQDTNASMGATKVCPGTHMCGEDQGEMCAVHGFQPFLHSNNTVWRTGDGVLFNQQLCHRGEAHTDGPARVMLVVSFTARPRLVADSRVLSSGLFCFSLWNIWGLTWQDLYRDAKYTATPLYRMLRSLGVWKPADANWGIDFLTKSVMQWNMGENGMGPEYLPLYASSIHAALGLPKFLQGRVIDVEDEDEDFDEDPFHVYFESTFQTLFDFFVKANLALVTLFLTVYALAQCFVQRARPPAARPLTWIALIVYIVPSSLLLLHLRSVARSEWGRNIQTGMMFRAPFPAVRKVSMMQEELYQDLGPTTVPERTDVLIGTRHESPYLGSVARWMDNHPGNRAYRSAVRQVADYYAGYRGLPAAFQNSLLGHVLDAMHGRMLQQEWQTGYWMVMDSSARELCIHRDIVQNSSVLLSELGATIDRMVARHRFEVSYRESVLAYETQLLLIRLKRKLLLARVDQASSATKLIRNGIISTAGRTTTGAPVFSSIRFAVTPPSLTARFQPTTRSSPKLPPFPKEVFRIGDTVLAIVSHNGHDGLARATILDIRENGDSLDFDIAYEQGIDEYNTPRYELLPFVPLESGSKVQCIRDQSLADAIVETIKPDGMMDIYFESDGEMQQDVDPNQCEWDQSGSLP